ncbi:hypothetical protein DFP93_1076 [Aneurinibacillus soli]|uniref:Uncharacterized protein n=1 Tax=Aneurinibacillus soli TaxID=1500254 RepID=A0A0U5BCR3_9BACL|nr:hypothetical protein [Aneurinibacillus soli]PYE61617.1 hypothetical protein DFP93_1076 [Aneurinibacillus soli]BAU28525.1 hypothetical protein CB4_02699 [Aneurinibacillus soli]
MLDLDFSNSIVSFGDMLQLLKFMAVLAPFFILAAAVSLMFYFARQVVEDIIETISMLIPREVKAFIVLGGIVVAYGYLEYF